MRHDYAYDLLELQREHARSARAIALRGELLALQVNPFTTPTEAREIEQDREKLLGYIDGSEEVPPAEEQGIRARWALGGK